MSLDVDQGCQRRTCRTKAKMGGHSACCDEECLNRIAKRNCEGGKCCPADDSLEGGGKTNHLSIRPCESHLKKAFDQYGIFLKELRCLCKELILMGEKSCCPEPMASQTSLISSHEGDSIEVIDFATSAENSGDSDCKRGCCGGFPPSGELVVVNKLSVIDDGSSIGPLLSSGSPCGTSKLKQNDLTLPPLGNFDKDTQTFPRPATLGADTTNEACCGGTSPKLLELDNDTSATQSSNKTTCASTGLCSLKLMTDKNGLTMIESVQATVGLRTTSIGTVKNCKQVCRGNSYLDAEMSEVDVVTSSANSVQEKCRSRGLVPKFDSLETPTAIYSLNGLDPDSKRHKKGCCDRLVPEAIAHQVSTTADLIEQRKGCCSDGFMEVAMGPKSPRPSPVGVTMNTSTYQTGRHDSSNLIVVEPMAVPLVKSLFDSGCKKGCCGNLAITEPESAAEFVMKGSCLPQVRDQQDTICCSKTSGALDDSIWAAERLENACCGGEDTTCSADIPGFKKDEQKPSYVDLEKGNDHLEHLVISVQGMTCTGCESKLYKSILALSGVYNVRTSLVRAEAEFDLDLKASKYDVKSTIQELERMTGFACQQVTRRGGILEIVIGSIIHEFLDQALPEGVQRILKLSNQRVQIIYNPRVIGARDVYRQLVGPSDTLAPLKQEAMNASKTKFLRALALTIFSAILTVPVLVLAWAPLPEHKVIYGAISFVLASIVQLVVAGPFYPSALKALVFARMIEMDLLIVISTSTAYVFSVVAYALMASGRPLLVESFFETSTLLITLVMCGRVATSYARSRATDSLSVDSLQAATAFIVHKEGQEEVIDCRLLQYGDIFKVYPDSTVPTDGTVFSGCTEVDESMVTGESSFVPKNIGSLLVAGTVNRTGTVTARLNRLPNENTITNIADMVNEASYSKPKIQDIADRVASYFVPAILAITSIVFVIWIAIGMIIQARSSTDAVVNAMTYALSALVVSCPCAVGLAVPMVVVVAGDIAAKNGLVFRTGNTITNARKVSHVIFDKTGTLTEGKPSVVSEICLNGMLADARSLTLALTRESKHPISAALAVYLAGKGAKRVAVSGLTSVVGKGVEATVVGTSGGDAIRGGNIRWIGAEDNLDVQGLLAQNMTVFCVRRGNKLIAAYGLRDTLRSDAAQVISELRDRGVEVSIVSGDEENTVSAVANELGIPPSNVHSRCSPGDKKKYIEDLTISSSQPPTTLFIGDGTNDAPALAYASIGVHFNDGTEVAKSAADVVLLTSSLKGILTLMDLSRAVVRRIALNFLWSFTYNSFAILLAAGAFVNVRIEPAYAGLGELISVLPVIFLALQLRWTKWQ